MGKQGRYFHLFQCKEESFMSNVLRTLIMGQFWEYQKVLADTGKAMHFIDQQRMWEHTHMENFLYLPS